MKLNPKVSAYLDSCEKNFATISDERKAALREIIAFIAAQQQAEQPVKLTFICTHNSRRSHFAQVWAAAAAVYYSVPNVHTFSGGTEATAFNPRSVAALQRAGLSIQKTTEGDNPRYEVTIAEGEKPLVGFSKKYSNDPNPTKDFCAVMTCSSADEACPVVAGAAKRVAIPYEDPKKSDGRINETATYDERCQQIATEMLYVFSQL
ncbi:MAG: low molecular weight phosphatase family protein [Bernardetiaceae bacterium]